MNRFFIGFLVAIYIVIGGEVYETYKANQWCHDPGPWYQGVFTASYWPVFVLAAGSVHLIFNESIEWECERKVTP